MPRESSRGANHGRRARCQALQLFVRRVRDPQSIAPRLDVRLGAESRHIPSAEFSPVGVHRRKRRPRFRRAQPEKAVSCSAIERIPQAARQRRIQAWRVGFLDQDEASVRCEDQIQRD